MEHIVSVLNVVYALALVLARVMSIGIGICINIGVGMVHLDIVCGIYCKVVVVYALELAILSFWWG